VKNVKTGDLLLAAWKQQIDAGRRLMELQAEIDLRQRAKVGGVLARPLRRRRAPGELAGCGCAHRAGVALVKARKKRAI
jgi:hypothetical protein